ncbi:hypothetical protein HY407_00485 [Candidatus Gottesmanbacteria bacterium]|nr:hypothetical protein [Candidatus Gottesmanbacteria bacterium]
MSSRTRETRERQRRTLLNSLIALGGACVVLVVGGAYFLCPSVTFDPQSCVVISKHAVGALWGYLFYSPVWGLTIIALGGGAAIRLFWRR